MSAATMTMVRAKAEHAIGAKPFRLVLLVDGVGYDVRPFEDDPEGVSLAEYVHKLKGPRGGWFDVYPRTYRLGVPPSERHRCTRCGHGGCRHVEAIVEVGLT